MTKDEYYELLADVAEHRTCEGWHYLTSYSDIKASSGAGRVKDKFVYKPGHGNPALVQATTYDIMCGGQVAIPAGRRALITLTSYVVGRPNSKWSIRLLADD